MNGLAFRIKHPDGRVEQVAVDAERVLVGSGAHCEIRLAAEHASAEHLSVQAAPSGVLAQARSFDPAPTVNGAPFTQGALSPDALVAIGGYELQIAATEVVAETKAARADRETSNPLVYVFAAIAVPLSLFVIFSDEPDDALSKAPKDVPALFGARAGACREQAPEQALALAREKLVAAAGKRERMPFHVQDGVAAVPLYETAAACFAVGGAGEEAREANDAASSLRSRLDDDYRTHRVRLEHALSVSDHKTAHKEARVLRAFLEGKVGEYATWLANLDRKLAMKYGKKG